MSPTGASVFVSTAVYEPASSPDLRRVGFSVVETFLACRHTDGFPPTG